MYPGLTLAPPSLSVPSLQSVEYYTSGPLLAVVIFEDSTTLQVSGTRDSFGLASVVQSATLYGQDNIYLITFSSDGGVTVSDNVGALIIYPSTTVGSDILTSFSYSSFSASATIQFETSVPISSVSSSGRKLLQATADPCQAIRDGIKVVCDANTHAKGILGRYFSATTKALARVVARIAGRFAPAIEIAYEIFNIACDLPDIWSTCILKQG